MRNSLNSAIVLLLVMAGSGRSLAADTRPISFATYLRAGPGLTYKPIDEIPSGGAVDVQSCADDWCLVISGRAVGYVAQSSLGIGKNTSSTTTQQTCFTGPGVGYGPVRPTEYCLDDTPSSAKTTATQPTPP